LLLVDDDPALAAVVAVLARKAGCQLACAADTATATPLLGGVDLVLLDVNLPAVSGPRWLASLTCRPPVALFVQSGLADDIAAGWDAGADFLFAKELVTDPPAWRRRLEEILTHADGHAGGSPSTMTPFMSDSDCLRVMNGLAPSVAEAVRRRAGRLVEALIRLLGSSALSERIRGV
jgi:DNA-binding response OmpR family regulator